MTKQKKTNPFQADKSLATISNSSGAAQTASTDPKTVDMEQSKEASPMRFFFLWFGLPMLFIAAIAWAMGRS